MMNSRVVEGGLAAAAVLITLGAVLGKLNPFQILMLSLLETPVFALNLHLGYSILGCVDVGKLKSWNYNLRVYLTNIMCSISLNINHKFSYWFRRRCNICTCIWSIFWLGREHGSSTSKDRIIGALGGITLHNRYICNGIFNYVVFFSNMKFDFKSLKLLF